MTHLYKQATGSQDPQSFEQTQRLTKKEITISKYDKNIWLTILFVALWVESLLGSLTYKDE